MGIMVGKAAEDGSRPMHLWGKLSREVKVGETAKGEPKVQFGVCYSRGEFMNILAVGNDETTRVACALEKGDVVSIDGVWSQRKYRTRDGEEKVWSELRADTIFSQSLLAAVLDILSAPRRAAASEAHEGEPYAEEHAKPAEDGGTLPWEQQEQEEPEYDYVPTI